MSITDGHELISPQAYGEHGVPHDLWTRLRAESPVHRCEPSQSTRTSVRFPDIPSTSSPSPGSLCSPGGNRMRWRAARSTPCASSSRWIRPSTAMYARSRATSSRHARSEPSMPTSIAVHAKSWTGWRARVAKGSASSQAMSPPPTHFASSPTCSACPASRSPTSCASPTNCSHSTTPTSSVRALIDNKRSWTWGWSSTRCSTASSRAAEQIRPVTSRACWRTRRSMVNLSGRWRPSATT